MAAEKMDQPVPKWPSMSAVKNSYGTRYQSGFFLDQCVLDQCGDWLLYCVVLVISLSNCRVGQNHVYSVYIRYFWQGNYQTYGHIQCIYTVLANPKH